MLSPQQTGYLRLFRREQLSHPSLIRAFRRFGRLDHLRAAPDSALASLELLPGEMDALLTGLAEQGNEQMIEQVQTWLAKAADRHLVCYEDAAYPRLLRETATPPPLLFVVGNKESLGSVQVALVGSRNASQSGERTAFWLARELAEAGFTICSGMAAGIDTQAHRGALEGGARTIAVLGTGADRIYPASNNRLAERIIENGALVSELPLGSPPVAMHFPQRNRIIAGLSVGVVVVEAALKSGSLITARLAMEENREVFALPGSIHSANARGCHRLIRDGARLADSVESIIEELSSLMLAGAEGLVQKAGFSPGLPAGIVARLTDDERRLAELIGFETCTPDWLVEHTGMPIGEINRVLAGLEIKGVLEREAGRCRCLVPGLQPSTY